MRALILLLAAAPAWAGLATITDTLKTPMGGTFSGRVVVSLTGTTAQPLYNSAGDTLTGWETTVTVTSGVFSLQLEANDTITPAGTSYRVRMIPANGTRETLETWIVPTSASPLKVSTLRSSTTPAPSVMISPQQISAGGAAAGQGLVWSGTSWGPASLLLDVTTTQGDMIYRGVSALGRLPIGSSGQVLGVSGGLPTWLAPPACATCVVTSGSYADPAWLTSLAGSKVSGNIAGNAETATALAANPSNCAAGTFPLGVDASGAAESCTALPTTIAGTANQITVSASTGPVTLSFPSTGMSVTAPITITGIVDQEQVIVNSPAGAIVDIQTWRVNNAVVADITSTGAIELTGSAGVAFEINGGRGTISEPFNGSMTLASGNLSNGNQVFNAGASGAHYWQYGGTTKQYADTNGLWFNNAQTLYWKDSGGTHREILRGQSDGYTGLVSLGNGFKFWSRGFGTSRMMLTDSGNLLVNTVSDDGSNKVQVAGGTSITGNLSVSNAATSGYLRIYDSTPAAPTPAKFITNASGQLRIYNNAYSTSLIALGDNGNFLNGTTTDLGYGFHAANKATNGNFLCFDPTATTGSTKCVFAAGQGQSGNILEVRGYNATPGSGTLLAAVASDGGFVGPYVLTGSNTSALDSTGLSMKSGFIQRWTATTTYAAAYDLSLSRASANTLQVGDGGSNANGAIMAKTYTLAAGTEGTCNSTNRGQVVMVQGGAGVLDTLRVCRKDAADAYAWTALY